MKMMVLLEGEGKERKVEEKVRKGGKGSWGGLNASGSTLAEE